MENRRKCLDKNKLQVLFLNKFFSQVRYYQILILQQFPFSFDTRIHTSIMTAELFQFSSQLPVTTADSIACLLSFLFCFNMVKYKSYDSFFLSFFQDYCKKHQRSHLTFFLSFFPFFLSFFLSFFFKIIMYTYMQMYTYTQNATLVFIIFTDPSTPAGYETRSIFKRILTGLMSEFSFS